ncbi:SHOCT domain-containing protein [Streptomyces sp. NBC_00503]|uniref:SHOCT domain-containing protein n=1 Tax=Streptomyces sp. NBC_00503 TaxID=2903659 RepID=UPI002E7FD210|nr:SHOCT domain-containing protein [Streptomyces sp. NBC_00503]WUD83592.1 SHOCT domain-containing protein [Streptomyces sp. NBC_00503]
MFIRPIGSVVNPAQRPAGNPLLRGILKRGAYVWDTARPQPAASAAAPAASHAAPAATSSAVSSAVSPVPSAAASASGPRSSGPAAAGAELTDQLTRLAALAREGLLTPEEFSTAKARLLGPGG